jgi:transposase
MRRREGRRQATASRPQASATSTSQATETYDRYIRDVHQAQDHFHAVKLANLVIDQIRRRVQQATLGHRGRKHDPLYRIRKLLLTAAEQLTQRGRARLRAGLAAGDPDRPGGGRLAGQGAAAHDLRGGGPGGQRAAGHLCRWADGVQVPELSRLARTVRAWEAKILAWHATHGCSNGPTEAVNPLIKKVSAKTAKPLSTGARVEQSYESHQLPLTSAESPLIPIGSTRAMCPW